MAESGVYNGGRKKSMNDMIAQLARIGETAGQQSPRYQRAWAAVRRYAENIKNTRKSREESDRITSLGVNNGSGEEIARLNRSLFNRRYSRRTYAKR